MGGQRVPSCLGRAQNEGSLWGPTLSFLSLGMERATRDSLILSGRERAGAHLSDKLAHPGPPGASPRVGCSRPSAVGGKAQSQQVCCVHMRGCLSAREKYTLQTNTKPHVCGPCSSDCGLHVVMGAHTGVLCTRRHVDAVWVVDTGIPSHQYGPGLTSLSGSRAAGLTISST